VSYRQAIALSGNEARYHNNLGAALAVQENLDEAIDHFNHAIKHDPDNTEAIFNLGNALFSQDKLTDAIDQYLRVIKLKPNYAKAHNNLAVALKKSGRLKEAYQHGYEAMRLKRVEQGMSYQEPDRNE
jgi:tetratricopeptide (TPR) repeat protein